MYTIRRNSYILSLLVLIGTVASVASSNADPASIDRQTVIESSPKVVVEKATIATIAGIPHSNYSKRLSDLHDQVNLAIEKGWLTPEQAYAFKNWNDEIVKEEKILRSASGGIIKNKEDADQLERHVNGLAYMITHEINSSQIIESTKLDNK